MNLHNIFTREFRTQLNTLFKVSFFPIMFYDDSNNVVFCNTDFIPPATKSVLKIIKHKSHTIGRIEGYYETGNERKQVSSLLRLVNTLVITKIKEEEYLSEFTQKIDLQDKQINYFYQICESLTSVFELKKVCAIILEMVIKIAHVERASIMLVNRKTKELTIFSSKGIPENIAKSVRIKIGDGISGKVALEGKPILVKDIHACKDSIDPKESKFNTSSFLSYPLIYSRSRTQKNIIGVINATDKKTGQIFTRDDLRLIASVGALATMVLQNAEFYNRIKTAYNVLKEKTKTVVNTQRSLVRSERLASLGTFSASVAHEIKSPLTAVMGALQMLMLKKDQMDAVMKYVEMIQTQVDFISKILSELLDFSRQGTPERYKEQINKVIEDTLIFTEHYLTRFKNVTVTTNLSEALPELLIDKGQIQQVFVNLINNAAQAMPDGGKLVIKSFLLSSQCKSFKGEKRDFVVVSFTDTGKGIAKEKLDSILKPFFTTKARGEGTGLGLWITQNILRNHEGELKVKSKPGKGSCFEVCIPV